MWYKSRDKIVFIQCAETFLIIFGYLILVKPNLVSSDLDSFVYIGSRFNITQAWIPRCSICKLYNEFILLWDYTYFNYSATYSIIAKSSIHALVIGPQHPHFGLQAHIFSLNPNIRSLYSNYLNFGTKHHNILRAPFLFQLSSLRSKKWIRLSIWEKNQRTWHPICSHGKDYLLQCTHKRILKLLGFLFSYSF